MFVLTQREPGGALVEHHCFIRLITLAEMNVSLAKQPQLFEIAEDNICDSFKFNSAPAIRYLLLQRPVCSAEMFAELRVEVSEQELKLLCNPTLFGRRVPDAR